MLYSLSYTVICGDALPDDDTGDIPYYSALSASVASFSVVIYRSQRWKNMPEYSKNRVRQKLELGWEYDANYNYGLGWWMTDRTYSKGGYGLERKRSPADRADAWALACMAMTRLRRDPWC